MTAADAHPATQPGATPPTHPATDADEPFAPGGSPNTTVFADIPQITACPTPGGTVGVWKVGDDSPQKRHPIVHKV